MASLFQLRADDVLTRTAGPRDFQHVGFAANLAVFNVALLAAGGRINRRFIPLAAAGTLESGLHESIILRRSTSGH